MTPRVSICVPNLNALPFLRERFETIFRQTLQDWELFVYDSRSDDGAWEFIQDLARREGRMRIAQGPREGPYPAWNECVRETKAEYVYIATSDDTMAPDCLEKMVAALERHKDCDLAHCPLVQIDEVGSCAAKPSWPDCTVFGHVNAELARQPHVSRAPYLGLLHLTGRSVFISITQLLIRRSLFSRIGDFPSKWRSIGDFNWEMRATLVANTAHVPDTWAGFRVHPKQLTASVNMNSPEHNLKCEEMIQDAILACEAELDPAVVAGLKSYWFDRTRTFRTHYFDLQRRPGVLDRRLFQASQLFLGAQAVRSEVIRRLLGGPRWGETAPREIRFWLESLGLNPVIIF